MKINEIFGKTDRSDFNETWLSEAPMGTPPTETFSVLSFNIQDFINHGIKPVDCGNNLKKIKSGNILLYWFEAGGIIQVASEVHARAQGLVVSMTGKNKVFRGKPPYASDLYLAILADNHKSLRLHSDILLSDEGLDIWKRLFAGGHKISVYDKENPGESFVTLHSIEELEAYFKHSDERYKQFQYVLSETVEELMFVRTNFQLRRWREGTRIKAHLID